MSSEMTVTWSISFNLKRDIAGVIHYEIEVRGRSDPNQWTPMCEPNTDWLNLLDQVDLGETPTCLWCLAEARKQ